MFKTQNIGFLVDPIDPLREPIDWFLYRKFKPQNLLIVFQTECPKSQNQSITYKNRSISQLATVKKYLKLSITQSIPFWTQSIPSDSKVIMASFERGNQRLFSSPNFPNGSKLVLSFKRGSPTPIEERESAPKIQIFILSKETKICKSYIKFLQATQKHSSHKLSILQCIYHFNHSCIQFSINL